MSHFKWLLLLILVTGCFRKASDPKSSAFEDGEPNVASNFRAQELTGNSISFKAHEIWEVPVEKTYDFRVCLISKATQQQLPSGQTFDVVLPNGAILDIEDNRTDDLGCFNWEEDQPFDFTGESVYIGKRRTLRAKGGAYAGSIDLHIGVNPWAEYRNENVPEVVDLNRRKFALRRMVPEDEEDPRRSGIFARSESAQLYFENDPAVTITRVKDISDGKRVRVIVRLNPFILPLSMNGMTPSPRPLTAGKFRIFANLISAHVGEKANEHVILASLSDQGSNGNGRLGYEEVDVHGTGVLTLQMEFDLKREIHMGEVQLALKVDPIHAPMSLSSHEGLYTLGAFKDLFTSGGREEIEGSYSNTDFNFGKYLRSSSNFEQLKEKGFADDLQPIYFEPLEPRFIRIGAGETATRRTVIYRVTTFVKDTIDGSPVKLQSFKVTKHLEGMEDIRSTDRLGRLVWFNELTHLYYQAERYFSPRFTIEQVSSGYKEERRAVVNPWDEGWTFGTDPDGVEEEYNELANQQVRDPLLMTDAFRYQTIRFRYVIDENMTLNVKKAVVMALDPLVQKFSIKEGRKIFEPLRDGIYLAHVALVKKYLDPYPNGERLVRLEDESTGEFGYHIQKVSESEEARKGHFSTVVKKLLRVQAGRITTPLEFSMRDLRMMSIRSNLMVQLETIDEDKLLRDNTVYQLMEEQMEEVVRMNSGEMSETQRAEFLAQKRADLEREQRRLREFITQEREQLDEFRGERNKIFDQRYEEVVGQEAELTEEAIKERLDEHMAQLDEIYSLSTQEYRDYRAEVMSNFVEMHKDIDTTWSEAAREWEEIAMSYVEEAQRENQPPTVPDNQVGFYNNEFDYFNNIFRFLDENGYALSIGADTLEKLELNNYTINPAAPFVDLDLYVDEESGLKKRTFIGPCTLVENDNMSEMRPTDTLDEEHADRIDSGQRLFTPRIEPPDNSAFEDSAYHDSLKPFFGWHVDDQVIPFHVQNEKHYEKTMLALSTTGRFVERYNLSYVSLGDNKANYKPITKFIDGCTFEREEDCFESDLSNVVSSTEFLNTDLQNTLGLLGRFFNQNPNYVLQRLDEEIIASADIGGLWKLPLELNPNADAIRSHRHYQLSNMDIDRAKEYINTHGEVKFNAERVTKVWIEKGITEIDLLDAVRACNLLATQTGSYLREADVVESSDDITFFERMNGVNSRSLENYLLSYCISKIKYMPAANQVFFDGVSFERRNIIYKTGPYVHNTGRNMNLNIGASFSLANYKDLAQSASLTVGGGAEASIFGVFGGEIAISRSNTAAEGANESDVRDLSTAVFLVVQEANMDIYINEHEKCLNLQFSGDFIKDLDPRLLRLKDNVNLYDHDVLNALTRGYFLCTGEVVENDNDENKYVVNENYYYVSQHFTAGDMLDEANLLNHVWLLALRGDRDFVDFVHMIDGDLKTPTGEHIDIDSEYKYPLDHLNNTYKKVLPSFPGMYTVPEPHPQKIIESVSQRIIEDRE